MYGLTIQLYSHSVDKGLKGIELPTGEFKFDLVVQDTLNGADVTGQSDYTSVLWDYRENLAGRTDTKGYLDRQMCTANKYTSAYATWIAPYNDGSDAEYACFEGGNFQIVQDAERGNVYHVTVKDYGFDMDNLWFRTNTCGSTRGNIANSANVGCFSSGYVEFVVQFVREVDATSNLYFTIEAEKLNVTSVSGQHTDVDQYVKDNQNSLNIPLYPRGSISK